MSRKRLLALVLLALLPTMTSAGEIGLHCWPIRFAPMEVAQIPVVLDVGYWVNFLNRTSTIKLHPINVRTYEGCLPLRVICNFNLSLRCTITPTGAVPGRYSCSITDGWIDAPGGTATICARLEDADLIEVYAGTRNVSVATVTVVVAPRF